MILGMPTAMFLIFAATLVAGCLGAIHYVTVHVIMGRPVEEYVRSNSGETSEERL
jgi:hypothetical protein